MIWQNHYINHCECVKIIHVNYSLRNEYESDLRSNEHYLSSSENMAWKKWVRKNGIYKKEKAEEAKLVNLPIRPGPTFLSWLSVLIGSSTAILVPVVRRLDNAIHWIKLYPVSCLPISIGAKNSMSRYEKRALNFAIQAFSTFFWPREIWVRT